MQNFNVQKCTKSDKNVRNIRNIINSIEKMEQSCIEVVAFLLRLIKI